MADRIHPRNKSPFEKKMFFTKRGSVGNIKSIERNTRNSTIEHSFLKNDDFRRNSQSSFGTMGDFNPNTSCKNGKL